MELFPKNMQGAGQALQQSYPLLLSMAQGLKSGQGAFAAAPQGLAAMMAMQKDRQEEQQRKEDMGLLGGMMGGGFTSTQGGQVPSPSYGGGAGQGQRNAALRGYGGPTNQAANALNVDFGQYEQQYGLPQGYLERVAQVESSMNPRAQNPNSSAGGLFQFIDSTAQQYGLQDRMDPVASTDAAARLARDNAAHLTRVLGRQPTAGELYLAHQQGAGGAAKMLSNPNARAVDVVGADAVRLNGGDENMTAGQFASKWVSKIDGQGGQQAQPGIMSAQGQQQGGGMSQDRLMRILQSPHISNAAKQFAMQRYEQSQPMGEMDRLQLQRARLELQQMQQPQQTDDMREYEYAQRQGYQGTFQDFMTDMRASGATNVTVNNNGSENPVPGLSKLGEGMTYLYDNQGNIRIDEQGRPMAAPVAGSDADLDRQNAERSAQNAAEQRQKYADVVLTDIGRAKTNLTGGREQPVTGFLGSMAAQVPGSEAADTRALVETIKANIGFDRLQEMREASPTGGALGQVTERELATLQSVMGNLEFNQSKDQLMTNLTRLEDTYLDIVHGSGNWSRGDDGSISVGGGRQPAQTQVPQVAPEYLSQQDRELWDYFTEEERKAILQGYSQ